MFWQFCPMEALPGLKSLLCSFSLLFSQQEFRLSFKKEPSLLGSIASYAVDMDLEATGARASRGIAWRGPPRAGVQGTEGLPCQSNNDLFDRLDLSKQAVNCHKINKWLFFYYKIFKFQWCCRILQELNHSVEQQHKQEFNCAMMFTSVLTKFVTLFQSFLFYAEIQWKMCQWGTEWPWKLEEGGWGCLGPGWTWAKGATCWRWRNRTVCGHVGKTKGIVSLLSISPGIFSTLCIDAKICIHPNHRWW